MTLTGFESYPFAFEGQTWDVYRKGEGPGVLVMHEVPGITPTVSGFAQRVVDAGYSVYMPDMFGVPGKAISGPYSARMIARACIRKEFSVLAANKSSPITIMLRALCREIHGECGGPGVGAIGMCLTGNFALALMVEPAVMAPVLSQPSLPFAITPKLRAAVHTSPEDLQTAVQRARDEDLTLLGLRFTHDSMCPKARFDTLREAFGDHFEAVEIDSGPGNPDRVPIVAHSVVSHDFVDREGHPTHTALQRVLKLFEDKLKTPV